MDSDVRDGFICPSESRTSKLNVAVLCYKDRKLPKLNTYINAGNTPARCGQLKYLILHHITTFTD